MENYTNNSQDSLIEGLKFNLQPGASYILKRTGSTFYPQGGNIYATSAGTKLIKINLTSSDWLDPSTLTLNFDLVNNSQTQNLKAISGGWSFFRRARLITGSGTVVEDIDLYNRVHEMMHILTATDSRSNDDVSGFGNYNNYLDNKGISYVSSENYATISFKPLFGLFNQPKFLPLFLLQGLILELELVDTATEPIYTNTSSITNASLATIITTIDALIVTATTNVATAETTLNTSLGIIPQVAATIRTNETALKTAINSLNNLKTELNNYKNDYLSTEWQIQNVQIKTDIIQLDSALQESYNKILLDQKEIPLHYVTYVSQMQNILNLNDVFLNISRAATRLKTIFVSLDKTYTNNILYTDIFKNARTWNNFHSPALQTQLTDDFRISAKDEFEFQIQIGGLVYPSYPIRSHAESFTNLQKAVGIQSSTVHSFDIDQKSYRKNKFIMAIDTEKSLEKSFTGINTRSGDLMSVKLKYNDTTNNYKYGDRMHVLLLTDNILGINMGGCVVYN